MTMYSRNLFIFQYQLLTPSIIFSFACLLFMGVTIGIRAGRILGLAMKCDKCVFPFRMCRVPIGLGCYSYGVKTDQLNPICMTFRNMDDRRKNNRRRGGHRPTVNPPGGADGAGASRLSKALSGNQTPENDGNVSSLSLRCPKPLTDTNIALRKVWSLVWYLQEL